MPLSWARAPARAGPSTRDGEGCLRSMATPHRRPGGAPTITPPAPPGRSCEVLRELSPQAGHRGVALRGELQRLLRVGGVAGRVVLLVHRVVVAPRAHVREEVLVVDVALAEGDHVVPVGGGRVRVAVLR